MKNIPLSAIVSRLEGDKDTCEQRQAEYMLKFERNPIYALEWVDAQFDYAAILEVAIDLLQLIEYGKGENLPEEIILAEVEKSVRGRLIFRAGSVTNRSTSQGTNLMNESRTQAWAKMYEWLIGR